MRLRDLVMFGEKSAEHPLALFILAEKCQRARKVDCEGWRVRRMCDSARIPSLRRLLIAEKRINDADKILNDRVFRADAYGFF